MLATWHPLPCVLFRRRVPLPATYDTPPSLPGSPGSGALGSVAFANRFRVLRTSANRVVAGVVRTGPGFIRQIGPVRQDRFLSGSRCKPPVAPAPGSWARPGKADNRKDSDERVHRHPDADGPA